MMTPLQYGALAYTVVGLFVAMPGRPATKRPQDAGVKWIIAVTIAQIIILTLWPLFLAARVRSTLKALKARK